MPKCFWCDKNFKNLTRDHVIPVSHGGGDGLNIVPACEKCNNERGIVSCNIKQDTIYLSQRLYDKWIDIETKVLGRSVLATLQPILLRKMRKCCYTPCGPEQHLPYCPSHGLQLHHSL